MRDYNDPITFKRIRGRSAHPNTHKTHTHTHTQKKHKNKLSEAVHKVKQHDEFQKFLAKVAEGRRYQKLISGSVDDAKKVFEKIEDGNKVTRAERWTLRYCLEHFNWTEAAHDWIVDELKKVPEENPAKRGRAAGKGYTQQIDGVKMDRAIITACTEALPADQPDGRISAAGAAQVWEKAADANKVTVAEKWTLRYCLSNFKWERDAHDYIIEHLKSLDAKGRVPAAAPPA